MAGNLQETIESIKAKVRVVIDRQALLLKEKEEVEARVLMLEEVIDQQRKEIERLRLETEYLKIASTLSPSRDDVEHTRAILSGLVREIDKCITDLTE